MVLPPLHSRTHLKLLHSKISIGIHPKSFSSSVLATNARPEKKLQITRNLVWPIEKIFNRVSVKSCGFTIKAQNLSGSIDYSGENEEKARGQSSMPERFRYLTKEAPDKPVRWPWLVVLAFMLYAWRTALWELSNWRKVVGAVGGVLGYILKFALALVFHFIGDPVTSLIRGVETMFYTVRAFYSGVIAYAPIPELTLIIMLTSTILAVAEAAVPDSVSSQPHLLTLAGIIGFAAVTNYMSELFFWTLLMGLFSYARLVEKRDYVSSALPLVAVLAAVGEPWVRVIVMASYTVLAIFHRRNTPSNLQDDKDGRAVSRVPAPLLCVALAIGTRIAAKWAGYRHLTWMIV